MKYVFVMFSTRIKKGGNETKMTAKMITSKTEPKVGTKT
jgi:hypothetical protein